MTFSRGDRWLIIAAVVMLNVIIIASTCSAETTKYIYDPVNRMIRVETGGGIASITATASTGGSIYPAGVLGVRYGDTQTFSITPESNNHIVDVMLSMLPWLEAQQEAQHQLD